MSKLEVAEKQPEPVSQCQGIRIKQDRKSALALQRVIEDNLLGIASPGTGNLLDDALPLKVRKLLRNATKDDLSKAIEICRSKRKGHAVKGHWLLAISHRIPEERTVGEVLFHEQLKSMLLSAHRYA